MTSGGGYIKLGEGNIDLHCPGLLSIKCAKLIIEGGVSIQQDLPSLPKAEDINNWIDLDLDGIDAKAMAGVKYSLKFQDGTVRKGVLDGNGYATEKTVPWGKASVIYHNDPAALDPKPQAHNAALEFSEGNPADFVPPTKGAAR